MSTFTLDVDHLLFDLFRFALIHGPNIPGSYAILLFTASDLTFITSPIHNCVLFLLWLHFFILSGIIYPLISSSILGTYRPGEFLFQCPIMLPSHTVHQVTLLKLLTPKLWDNEWILFEATKYVLMHYQLEMSITVLFNLYKILILCLGCYNRIQSVAFQQVYFS